MLMRAMRLLLLCLALGSMQTALAQMPTKGLIIRVMEGAAFIDLGRQDGVQEGDYFDIVDAEVLTHPLSGDTLAITPKSVGALRVRQVYEKMSLAEVLHVQSDADPMLMQIARIDNPDRLLDIEKYMKSAQRADGGVSRTLALVPGLYQYRTGEKMKGLMLMGLETAALATAFAYRSSSNDWKDQYDRLPPGSDFDFYFDEASKRRSWSNRFFWIAGAFYTYNWVDVLWMGNAAPMNVRTHLDMGVDGEGQPLLRLVHHF